MSGVTFNPQLMYKYFNDVVAPEEIINAATEVMGSIDFDPCSTPIINQYIGAKEILVANSRNPNTEWAGNTWLFPPYESRTGRLTWLRKAYEEYRLHRCSQLMILAVGRPSDSHIQSLLSQAGSSICFFKQLTAFRNDHTGEVIPYLKSKSFILSYQGVYKEAFRKEFSRFGAVVG